MIEKLAKVLAQKNWENSTTKEEDEYINKYFPDCYGDAEDVYDALTEDHYLVEKDKVELVEGNEKLAKAGDMVLQANKNNAVSVGYDLEVNLSDGERIILKGGKPAIPKEYIL